MSDALVLARRNLEHVRQVPEKLIEATLQPLVLILLFAYIFGSAIELPEGSYREYLVPGVLVQVVALGIMGPGVAIATDLTEGIVDRLRSLPAKRHAYLTGHLLAALATGAIAIAFTVATGYVVGWRIHTGLGSVLAAVALIAAFAIAMTWLGLLLGLSVRSPDAVGGVVFVTVFPLTFVSNVFVPAGGLPAGVRAVAEYNPISAVVAALRELLGNPAAATGGWPLRHPVLSAFAWACLLAAIAAPLALRAYARRTAS
jgi:ABC-2 type transport system permease protein